MRGAGYLWAGGVGFFGSFYLLLSTLPLYASALGVGERALGLIIGCFAVASMAVKPWAGWAADRWGRRPLLMGGAGIFLIASLMYGVTGGALGLLAVRLFHGSGMGLFPTAATAVVADIAPPGRRGEYIGLFGAATNVAMALAPISGLWILERWGFPTLFAVAGAVALGALCCVARMPETLTAPRRTPLSLRGAFSRRALQPAGIVLLMMLSYGAQVAFVPLWAHERQLNAGLFFLVLAAVVALCRGPLGRLSDRVGRPPVVTAGLGVMAGGLVVLALGSGTGALAGAAAIYGAGMAGAQPALMAWCLDRVGPDERGRATGTYYTGLELGIALGAAGAGLVAGTFGFRVMFAVAAAVALAAAMLSAAAGRRGEGIAR